jgi:hypothetical protein
MIEEILICHRLINHHLNITIIISILDCKIITEDLLHMVQEATTVVHLHKEDIMVDIKDTHTTKVLHTANIILVTLHNTTKAHQSLL